MMLYQIRGFNHIRMSPRDTCRGYCPELTETLAEGEIRKETFPSFLLGINFLANVLFSI